MSRGRPLRIWGETQGTASPTPTDRTEDEHGMTDIQGTLYTGYDEHDDRSYLLTVWPDGILEVATRPGRDDTRIRWSPPVRLTREPLS